MNKKCSQGPNPASHHFQMKLWGRERGTKPKFMNLPQVISNKSHRNSESQHRGKHRETQGNTGEHRGTDGPTCHTDIHCISKFQHSSISESCRQQPHDSKSNRTPMEQSVPKIQTSWSQVWPIPFPYTLRSPFHQNTNRSDSTPDHQWARHSTCSHSQPLNINVQSSLEYISDKQFFEYKSKYESRPERPPSPPSPPSFTNGHQVLILRPTPKYTLDEGFQTWTRTWIQLRIFAIHTLGESHVTVYVLTMFRAIHHISTPPITIPHNSTTHSYTF